MLQIPAPQHASPSAPPSAIDLCGSEPHAYRIVLTGGPGAGKTTAGDILRRELGKKVAFVPEAATMLFNGGFPRYSEANCVKAAQKAIYAVQVRLEECQKCQHPGRILLCDRGTLDGAVYYPEGMEGWCADLGTTMNDELARYDAVIFFQSAAVVNHAINGSMLEGGNPARLESLEEARTLDERLHEVWSRHPKFFLVKSRESFFEKLTEAVEVFKRVVRELDAMHSPGLTPEPTKREIVN